MQTKNILTTTIYFIEAQGPVRNIIGTVSFKTSHVVPMKSNIKVRDFEGFKVPNFTVTLERFREALSYKPNKNDLILNTYPKSGTTWMIYIVWSILNEGATPPNWQEMNESFAPELEVEGTAGLERRSLPRVLKTHLQPPFLPYSDEAKYIYVARNPWDTCLSYYNYAIQRPNHFGLHEDSTFENFVIAFAEGELPYGYYFSHVAENYRKRHNDNFFFITYEEMKEDLKACTLRVAQFLGDRYYERLKSNDGVILNSILEFCNFEYMRQLSFLEKENNNVREVNFFQKGYAGYAKSSYGENEIRLLQKKIQHYFPNAEFQDLLSIWERY